MKNWMLGSMLGLTIAITPHVMAAPKQIDISQVSQADRQHLYQQGLLALQQQHDAQAIVWLSELVARYPQQSHYQVLLALSYHLLAAQQPDALALARAGYDLAIKADAGQALPFTLAGYVAYQQADYPAALAYLAQAVLRDPQNHELLTALAGAAYMQGDIHLAQLALDRVLQQTQPSSAQLQLAALVAAAQQQPTIAQTRLTQLRAIDAPQATWSQMRVAQLLQTASVDQVPIDTTPASEPVAVDQVALDVTIILSQNTQRDQQGMNLFDGLSAQYGYNKTRSRQFDRVTNEPDTQQYRRSITEFIGIPQLTYNLNLFNRAGQYYSVLARPQLTAYRKETSEFFVGRSVNLAVRGVNSSQLEKIDVGIEMRVTPLEITEKGTKVRIETGRSFLTTDAAGNFAESLTTFRQRVSATAEIQFGQTLLLSGLSETVRDKTFSKTPWLGSVPVLKNFFNDRNELNRQDSVMVLVTPAAPIALQGRPWLRDQHVQQLTKLWTEVVDPSSHAQATAERLTRMQIFSRMSQRDIQSSLFAIEPKRQQVLQQLMQGQVF